jgi:ABC-2 type transport system ATP-binding protein
MTPAVTVEGLCRSYSARVVLRDVTFTAHAGKVVGLIGPNGAGKTTMLRVIAGLQRVDAGVVCVNGRVAYFGGERTIPPGVRGRRWLRLFHSSPRAFRNDRVGLLSRGTRQVLGLQAVFAGAPADVVLLDEPWEGLDPDAARWLTGAVATARDRGAAILASSHRLHDLAAVCDSCLFLDHGTATWVDVGDPCAGEGLTGERLVAAFDAARRKAR